MTGTRGLTSVVLVVLALASPAAADEASPAVRGEIVRLTRALLDAMTDGKSDVWARTLADDAVVIDEFGRRQTKAEIVKSVRPLPQGFSGSIEVRSATVHQYGDAAVIDCENYEQETVHGQQLVVRY